MRGNSMVITIAVLLVAVLVASFAVWANSDPFLTDNRPRLVYVWSLMASVVFLLVTRIIREHGDRR